jgi:ribosomal protein S12
MITTTSNFAWHYIATARFPNSAIRRYARTESGVVSSNEIYVDKTKTNLAGLEPILRKRVSGSDAKQIRAVLEDAPVPNIS